MYPRLSTAIGLGDNCVQWFSVMPSSKNRNVTHFCWTHAVKSSTLQSGPSQWANMAAQREDEGFAPRNKQYCGYELKRTTVSPSLIYHGSRSHGCSEREESSTEKVNWTGECFSTLAIHDTFGTAGACYRMSRH